MPGSKPSLNVLHLIMQFIDATFDNRTSMDDWDACCAAVCLRLRVFAPVILVYLDIKTNLLPVLGVSLPIPRAAPAVMAPAGAWPPAAPGLAPERAARLPHTPARMSHHRQPQLGHWSSGKLQLSIFNSALIFATCPKRGALVCIFSVLFI